MNQFTQPPPPGVECDCEYECACSDAIIESDGCPHGQSHWHQRFMGMRCDAYHCGSEFQADVFAYTRRGAIVEIERIAKERGWTERHGKWFCS